MIARLRIHPTVRLRLRLTLTYAALFLVAGALLLGLTYVLLSRALAPPPPPPRDDHGPPGVTAQDQNSTQSSIEDQIRETQRQERADALRQVQIQAITALLLTSIGALALGWVVAGRVLSPIRAITTHARRASEATLSDRIDLRGPPDELKELVDTIDGMLDRL